MNYLKYLGAILLSGGLLSCGNSQPEEKTNTTETKPASTEISWTLKVSDNGRYFVKDNGDPFFWLGDTGWLLFTKNSREDAEQYLEDRRNKGYNVIQVMVIHDLGRSVNAYGDSAVVNKDLSKPKTTEGNSFNDSAQYDYWDHVDYVVDLAAQKGMYIAMVPVWGSNVKGFKLKDSSLVPYISFLANRYKDKPNIIWMNGGDIKPTDALSFWETEGKMLDSIDHNHLITYHPRGRWSSSSWFHNEKWLDFNMIQSGHRDYGQDTSKGDWHYGEDNWKYINVDYALSPAKPVLDGEPIYEGIPHGLHDTTGAYWKDADLRRYGYWSVFAGGCGFTYGHNAVMQFFHFGDAHTSYGPKLAWKDALNEPGAVQMQYLKNLMLSKPYLERVPDQSMVADNGEKYDYIAATRGKEYAFLYTYTGRNFKVNMGKTEGAKVKATWFSPASGQTQADGEFDNTGVHEFNPPGDKKDGNDWVLILEKV